MSGLPGRPSPASFVVLVIVLSCLTGCAEPPRKEMDQAQGAIDTARAAGAAEYAGPQLEAAVAALDRADDAVEQRDYRQALHQAMDARERAQQAARDAANRQAEVRSTAERDAQALRTALDAATRQRDLWRAQRPPVPALADLEVAITAAETSMQEARTHLDGQAYLQAASVLDGRASQLEAVLAAAAAQVAATPPARPARPARRPR